jgi:ABC-type antimicrobial peptide transport system permease subunit
LQFRLVRNEGISAVKNAVDFGELFLSLSFFVIAAGILLTALLFSLHIQSRNRESGVLAAIGFSRKQILRFRMLEALLVIVAGSVAGTFAGILYNYAIMAGLNSVWQDVVQTTTLWIHVKASTLFTGAIAGIIIAFSCIFFIGRTKMKQPVKALISKSFAPQISTLRSKHVGNSLLIIFALGISMALIVYSLLNTINQNSGLFLPAGGLLLLGLLALIYRLFQIPQNKLHASPLSLWQLALKNASRNKTSSLASIALLTLGTFTIIITGANQQTFYGASTIPSSGTGGFLFWTETSVPLIYDLNTTEGKEKYGLEDEPILKDVEFVQFHNLQGDDASCLNLNQVNQPQILGVDAAVFDQKGSFAFANLRDDVDENHPWLALDQETESGLIPAFADQTVITWGLMKKVGDTLSYLNEQGKQIKLLLIGGLKSSVFQGNILIADRIFIKNFPSTSGSEIMLIDAPAASGQEISKLLEDRLTDFGLELTPTATRLASFNAVTNTYLSVFMILGGLGVLIGTIGLGIVLLRNMLERKSELTLLSAIGFDMPKILRLVFIENLILLVAGILAGIVAALIGILPSLLSPSYEMNTPFILLIISAVFFSGLLWIYFPARQSLKKFSVKDLQED